MEKISIKSFFALKKKTSRTHAHAHIHTSNAIFLFQIIIHLSRTIFKKIYSVKNGFIQFLNV